MVDPLSTDEGQESSGGKENFIGEVVFSRKECDCEICSKGKQRANFERDEDTEVYEHPLHVKPLTRYEKNQNTLSLTINNGWTSKWMIFIGHLQEIHGNLREHGVDSMEALGEFLTGRVYEFRDITWEEDEDFQYPSQDRVVNFMKIGQSYSQKPNEMMVPVREVTDEDELAELGAEDSPGEVEEVSFD